MANREKSHPSGMPFDVGSFNAAYERNLNAWMAASKMMADGIQAAAERHMKFAQDMAGEMMENFDLTKAPGEIDFKHYMMKLQDRIDTMVAEAREVQEIVVKAQTSALQTMYQSLTDNLEQAGVPSETIAAAVSDAMTRAEAVVESVSEQLRSASASALAHASPTETAASAATNRKVEDRPSAPAATKPAVTRPTAAKPAASRSTGSKPAEESAPAAPKPRTRRTRPSTSSSPSSSGSN